jgi:hypothetical protein
MKLLGILPMLCRLATWKQPNIYNRTSERFVTPKQKSHTDRLCLMECECVDNEAWSSRVSCSVAKKMTRCPPDQSRNLINAITDRIMTQLNNSMKVSIIAGEGLFHARLLLCNAAVFI